MNATNFPAGKMRDKLRIGVMSDRTATIDAIARAYHIGRYDHDLQTKLHLRIAAAALGGVSVLLVASAVLSLII